ncbi:MAG: hypothetical protein ABSF71_08990 [Terriglobia bacterium]|jgi:hypothetical protein
MADTVTFQVRSGGSLADAFTGAPAGVRAFFRRGGSVLSKVSPEKYEELIRIAAESLNTSHLPSRVPSELASVLNISEQETTALLGAASVLVGTITQRQEPPEAVVKAAAEAQFLEPADVPAAVALAQVILRERDAVAVIVERARIGVEVLPSFEDLAATTDVRLGFKEGHVSLAVPVVVAHLSTDSSKGLWLQLTRGQIERLIKQLEDAKRNLEAAEQWIEKPSRGSVKNV